MERARRAIDQPLKSYSTGMAMRLAFSIATQVDPDVLIVDEALSVGDGYFQKKSMDRMNELVRGGTTLLFCSHAMYYVSAFCERALWLAGPRRAAGRGPDVIATTSATCSTSRAAPARPPPGRAAGPEPPAPGPARLAEVTILTRGAMVLVARESAEHSWSSGSATTRRSRSTSASASTAMRGPRSSPATRWARPASR